MGNIEAEALSADLARLKGHAKEQNELFRNNLHCFLPGEDVLSKESRAAA